jgi:CheY-like chemotaxis protein
VQVAGRILVADDYEPNLSGMRDLLEVAGYCVDTASSGTQALRAAEAGAHDVILLDVVMRKFVWRQYRQGMSSSREHESHQNRVVEQVFRLQ